MELFCVEEKKSGNGRFAPAGVRRSGEAAYLQPHSQSGLRPEGQTIGAGKEKRKWSFCSDRRKTIWRSGMFSAAQPEWLTTRGADHWSWTRKAEMVVLPRQA
ncbi:hypothetical protein EEX84_00500 [Planococcus salinus]|uniref:Uncharacterized protein n=1 Tax=Planococcus salinus TaxID=1848460 RepID=A0A3M8PCJ4_9BACL|nr:hypothetical protein EEX84_00500 [Planococcus salinus]